MRFWNSVTVPKNVKGGILWDFLTSILLQNIETNEGGTLRCSSKISKKVKNTRALRVLNNKVDLTRQKTTQRKSREFHFFRKRRLETPLF